MLTRIEMQYMNAVIGIHDEIRKANERGVDWEQRRYEIAKEMLPYTAETTRSILMEGHGLGDEAEGKTVPEVCASSAVAFADALIAELRKEQKEEWSEEEQHRKWILEYLYDGLRKTDEQFKEQFRSAIAWLEKLSEKESDPRYNILDELIYADDIFQMSMNDAMVENAKAKAVEALNKIGITKLLLEKQGEKKSLTPKWMIDFLEEYRPNIGCALSHYTRKDVEGKMLAIKDWLEKNSDNDLTD